MNKQVICLLVCLAVVSAGATCGTIQQMVALAEGKQSCVYSDTKGIPTIGIGFNLKRSDARSIITSLGLSYDLVLNKKQCLTESQITALFNKDLVWAKAGAAACISSFNSQPTCIQNVLIDMTFNMGKSALCSWPIFSSQLAAKKYKDAAANMKGSAWCSQVKSRCTRNVDIVGSY